VLSAAADVTFVIGADGLIRFASDAVERVLGRTPDDCAGTPIAGLLHPDDREVFIHRLADLWSTPDATPRSIVVRASHADGAWVSLEASGLHRLEHDEANGVVITAREVDPAGRADGGPGRRAGGVEAADDVPAGSRHDQHGGPVVPSRASDGPNRCRDALADGAIELWYQPIRSLVTGDVWGFEGLVRWNRGPLGVLEAARFLPEVDGTDVMFEIGDHVLAVGCAHLADWQRRLGSGAPLLSLNVPFGQFCLGTFARRVRRELDRSGADPRGLCLELTETQAIDGRPDGWAELGELRALGIAVALDDFGTGYSSLNHLYEIGADVLKIDRRFVAGLGVDDGATAIVRASIELAAAFGMVTVAEGVSTPDQQSLLAAMGCDRIQGFHVGPALPGAQAIALAAAGATGPTAPVHRTPLQGTPLRSRPLQGTPLQGTPLQGTPPDPSGFAPTGHPQAVAPVGPVGPVAPAHPAATPRSTAWVANRLARVRRRRPASHHAWWSGELHVAAANGEDHGLQL
jgi:PAS domain S-box-containing protein